MHPGEAQVRPTILVVDGESAQHSAIVGTLVENHFDVTHIACGEDALRRVYATVPDLLVLNAAASHAAGLELCARLKAEPRTRELPVVLTSTAFSDVAERVRGLDSGADACLMYPPDARELTATVDAILRRRGESQAANARVREMLESITDGFFALDSNWHIIYFNKRAEQILGKSREYMLGRVLWDVYPEAVDSVFFTTYERVRTTRRSDIVEAFYAPLGSWFESRVYPAPNGGITIYFRDVSDRHRQQEALREREEWLRLATEAVGIGLWQRDISTRELKFTPTAKVIFGKASDAELTHDVLYNTIHPDDRDQWQAKIEAVESGQTRDYNIEYRVVWKDGTEHWVQSRAIPLRDEHGDVVRLLGIAEDITERKTLEMELGLAKQLAEDRLRQLETVIENMAEAICVLDAEGVVLLTNRGFREMFGYENTPHLPRNLSRLQSVLDMYDLDTGEALPTSNWPMAHVLRGATVRNRMLRVVRSDVGKDMILSTSGAPVRGTDGKVIMAVMTVQDVTPLADAQRKLRASQQHLEVAQRAAQVGSFDWEIGSPSPIYWTREMERLYGFAEGEWTGRYDQWIAMVLPEDVASTEEAVQNSIADGTEYQTEFRIRRADTGEIRWISARGQPFYDADGNPLRMVGVNIDVTERRQAEDALRSSEKLAAAGRMAGTLAHEINNPMAAITNLVYLLAQSPALDPVARSYVKIAEQELGRVQHIIKNTLGFYRESAVPVQVSVGEVLDSVLDLYSRKITDKQLRVDKRYDFAGTVRGYPGELRQVFSNIVVNAIEALPEGGRLRVRTRHWTDPRTGAAGVRATIADNGPGIPPDLRQKIFEPFFTTKGEKGTGLGLWVTMGIVLKHSGSLKVRSCNSGQRRGTSFVVFLPLLTDTGNPHRAISLAQSIQ